MKLKLLAFGIAKDILESRESVIEFSGQSLGDLRAQLYVKYPKLEVLRSLQFAVKDSYESDSYKLSDSDEVILIPPVSGG